jgi:uncharacterized protein (TIGR02466 family)
MADEHDLGGRQAWPTMFFYRKWKDHAAHAPGIVEHLYQRRDRNRGNIASGVAPAAKSGRGLYESDFDLLDAPHDGVRSLRAWFAETVAAAVSVANGGRVNPKRVRVEFPDSWAHITNDGGFHDAHYHGNCSWCGIYYVQAGDARGTEAAAPGNGVSRFYSPIPTGGMATDYGSAYLSTNRIDITPVDGLLILFPAYLLHSGLPYTGKADRILIAFNSRSEVAAE